MPNMHGLLVIIFGTTDPTLLEDAKSDAQIMATVGFSADVFQIASTSDLISAIKTFQPKVVYLHARIKQQRLIDDNGTDIHLADVIRASAEVGTQLFLSAANNQSADLLGDPLSAPNIVILLTLKRTSYYAEWLPRYCDLLKSVNPMAAFVKLAPQVPPHFQVDLHVPEAIMLGPAKK